MRREGIIRVVVVSLGSSALSSKDRSIPILSAKGSVDDDNGEDDCLLTLGMSSTVVDGASFPE